MYDLSREPDTQINRRRHDGMDASVAEAAEMQGTPTTRPHPWLRRTTTALLATVPLLSGFLPPSATAHAATPAAASASAPAAHTAADRATGAQTADVSINSLTPAAPSKDDTVSITGTVKNDSRNTIADSRVSLRTGPELKSRSAIEQASRQKGFVSAADGKETGGKRTSVGIGTMRPGISRSFAMKVPAEDLKLRSSGIHQLGVSLTGKTRARPSEQVLGIERTFLPWQASDAQKKTALTYLWPLISTSHLTARTDSDEEQTPVFRDDTLAEELAPGGRLQQMVSLGKDLPITWVIDPDLLATVEAMTGRYRVETKGGKTVAGKGQKYAKQWLMDLQDAVKGEEVVALPFADPDLASLAHRGKNVPGALGHLRPATELASTTVETILHTRPNTDFAWPVEGAVDRSVVDVATSAGAHNVITRSDHLRDPAISYTPTSARPIGGGNTALAADAGLSKAFDRDLSKPGSSSKAVQEFLAQTQAVTAQVPTKQRSVVVAPQRMPDAAQVRAMATALSALNESGRWTEGSDLSEAAEAKPDPKANRQVPREGSYPSSLRDQELPKKAYEQVERTAATLDEFKEVLSQEERVVVPFGNAGYRSTSNSWRTDGKAGDNFRESVQSYLTGLTKKIRLIQKSPMTLSGRSATIPVTVQNNLVQDVDGLKLRLKSSRTVGLDVGEDQQVKVAGGHSQSVKFSTSAKSNGRKSVVAQLYTEDGKPYGKPMTFQVSVTEITSTVLLVIAGGVLLVVLAGVRMYTQRKRRGPAADPDAPLDESRDDAPGDDGGDTGGPGGESGPDSDGPDSGQGTDDTGRDDGNPSGTGEKVNR